MPKISTVFNLQYITKYFISDTIFQVPISKVELLGHT